MFHSILAFPESGVE